MAEKSQANRSKHTRKSNARKRVWIYTEKIYTSICSTASTTHMRNWFSCFHEVLIFSSIELRKEIGWKWPNRARAGKNEKWPNSARTTKIHRMEERQVERRETNRERKAKWSLGSNELHRLGNRDAQYHISCNGIVRDKRCCLVWISVKAPSSAPYKRLYVLHCTSVKMAEKCQSRNMMAEKCHSRKTKSFISTAKRFPT